MELSIAIQWEEIANRWLQEGQSLRAKGRETVNKPTKEAMRANITPAEISTRDTASIKISSKDKKKEVKWNEPFRGQKRYKHTLKELEEKTYPFPGLEFQNVKDVLHKTRLQFRVIWLVC